MARLTPIIAPVNPTRHGWQEAFRAMHAAKDDRLLLSDTTGNQFDQEEWEW